MTNINKDLNDIKDIINNLLVKNSNCKTKLQKQQFIIISVKFIRWIISIYAINIVEEFILSTQVLDLENGIEESFKTITQLVKLIKNKLNLKNKESKNK